MTASVAVVMVNYRTPDLALAAARALAAERARLPGLRLVIVDGYSDDGSVDTIADGIAEQDLGDFASLLALPVNGGFGWANNQAMLRLLQADAPLDYIHLINPDAEIEEGAVAALAAVLDQYPRCAAVGSLLLNEDGSPSGSAFRFPTPGRELLRGAQTGALARLFGIAPTLVDDGKAGEVEWATGASVMFRATALRETGLFDTAFFLYFEEVELTHRLARVGWAVRHEPTSRVRHLGGAATGLAYNRKDLAVRPPLPPYWFASRRRCLALIGGRRMALSASIGWLAGHALYMARRAIGRGGNHIPNRHEARDLLRHGLIPSKADLTPDVTHWNEPPGRTPAWMTRATND